MENEKQILNYLLDNLSAEERASVENSISNDTEFAKEYKLLRSMHMYALMQENKETWQPALEEMGAKYFESKPNKLFNLKSWIKVITLILTLIGLVFLAFYITRDTQDLYEKHNQHFALHLTLKSSDTDQNQAIKAERTFNNEEYLKAYNSLQEYLADNPIDTKAKLALGICALELGKKNEAIAIFDQIRTGKSTLKDYGTWYKALYEIRNSNYQSAKELLTKISDFDPLLVKKSTQLQKDLDKELE